MNVIATSVFPNGLITFPVGISGTIYFVDYDQDSVSGAVIRSYVPTTISNKVNTTKFSVVNGANQIFDGTKLSVIAYDFDTGDHFIYIFDPATDTWINSNESLGGCFPYTYSVSGNSRYVFFGVNGVKTPHVTTPTVVYVLDTLVGTSQQITTDFVDIPVGWEIEDIALATRYTSGSPGELVVFTVDIFSASTAIINYTIPASPPFISGSWSDITPTTLSSGNYYCVSVAINYSHSSLAKVETLSGIDDVFSKYYLNDTHNFIALRHVSGTVWEDTGLAQPYLNFFEPSIFGVISGTLFNGDYYENATSGETIVYTFTSSATLTSSWINTNFPTTSGFMRVFDMGFTTGSSGAIYIPVTFDGVNSSLLGGLYTITTSSAVCTITNAVSGDIYNVGGVSNEPTTHIVFTLWDNKGYGRGRSR